MQGGDSNSGLGLGHLKLANAGSKMNSKGIDIRKGINIEKNMKMTADNGTGAKPALDFNIIQHSQSNFDGVKGVLMKHTKPDPRSKAAIASFANAGGANHMLDPAAEGDESYSDDEPDAETFKF
jgi:hypothetical protein